MENWFSRGLIKWYEENKRSLPWREEKDPYKIWLSEIILQQTQVVQGLAYYLKFVNKYPTVEQLAKAKEDEVLKLWQGLGYYSRARNLHSAARYICEFHKGKFPKTYPEIKGLKGVGDYTAAAIASFAYNMPHAVVDGNVYRVLSRVFGIETPIDSSRAKKEFQNLADELLDKKNPATYNQGIMEFGSQHCKPVNPDCENCIFKNRCSAFKTNSVSSLPIKAKKTKVRIRYFNYLVIADKNKNILVNRRGENDIWQGLYEFVLIETSTEVVTAQLLAMKEAKKFTGKKPIIKQVSRKYKHILSHQHLYAQFVVMTVTLLPDNNYKKVPIKKLTSFAFPRLIEKFLNDCDLKEII